MQLSNEFSKQNKLICLTLVIILIDNIEIILKTLSHRRKTSHYSHYMMPRTNGKQIQHYFRKKNHGISKKKSKNRKKNHYFCDLCLVIKKINK